MMRRAAAAAVMMTAIAGGALAQTGQAGAERTPRPQEPVGAVPYRVEAITVEVPADDAGDTARTLAGTLTLPDASRFGEGPYPGVVLISGSGPQDRDSTLMGHKPFLVLADRMTRAGIAVLRYDDRGVGKSTGDFAQGTITRFARDARAAAAVLRGHDAVDPERVGLMGHSEGGMVAPMASIGEPVSFLVLLAGTGVPGADVLLYQSSEAYRRGGLDEAWIEENTRIRRTIFDAISQGVANDELRPLLRELVEHEMSHIRREEDRARMAEQLTEQFGAGWFREFVSLDPRDALRRVSVPVLAINGTLDTQVDADRHLPEIERALAQSASPSVMVVRMLGLNHLFQPAESGMVGEYGVIETTFDERAMGLISGWILGVTGVVGE